MEVHQLKVKNPVMQGYKKFGVVSTETKTTVSLYYNQSYFTKNEQIFVILWYKWGVHDMPFQRDITSVRVEMQQPEKNTFTAPQVCPRSHQMDFGKNRIFWPKLAKIDQKLGLKSQLNYISISACSIYKDNVKI